MVAKRIIFATFKPYYEMRMTCPVKEGPFGSYQHLPN
jgi:hypothetical protein